MPLYAGIVAESLNRITIFAGFAGLAAGAALALVFGYWKERRRWQEDITDYSVGDEFDNDEF
jgi:hypothetical protein